LLSYFNTFKNPTLKNGKINILNYFFRGFTMKVKAYKKDLQEAFKKVISEKKSALPILTNFLLKAEDGKLTVYGTDLEVYTSYIIPADVEEEGSICVNSKKMIDISKVLAQNEALLYTDGETLKITSGKTKYSLPTFDSEDFPLPESYPSDLTVLISGKELLEGVSRTIYAVSKDESRFALNGVCFSFIDDKLEFVATDGHRLALYSTQISGKLEGKYIVPQKALNEIKKLVSDVEDVEVAVSGSSIFFKGSNYILSARLLEGIFPDYKQVIPDSFNIEITLSKSELIESIKRVIIAEENDNKPIKLRILDNKLIISTPPTSDAYAEDEIEVSYDGEEFEIGFNGKYILDAVDEIENENIVIKFINKDSQTVIVPGNSEERYLAVVMPMTI
jgi:DNA polymerase-3 subunit beta